MMCRTLPRIVAVLALIASALPFAAAETGGAEVPVETFKLDNGMEFLLIQKPELTTVSAGWVAHVGSSNESVGTTGLAHFFEHMMFKGTRTIGTTNIERDLEILAEQERLQDRIREIYREQRHRFRRGEIDDPFDPKNRTPELVELEAKFQELVDEQRALMVKDEFDQIYTKEGASGMNAFTSQDVTAYFITVPANKLELWFWMESDRLANPVLREFYSERDVVHEERRLRTESTPTGKYDEQFNAMFWQSHPYKWPIVGWPSDIRMWTKKQATAFYENYYSPNNLTAALVGNFELAEAKALAERYFGRLERGPTPPDVVTLEMPQLAEKRMYAECDCQPQVEVRFHTVPFMNKDTYALDVLAGLLNGRTGRLYKSLVLDKQIASSVSAGQQSQKWAGAFSFSAETKGDATPDDLEDAIDGVIERLKTEPVPAEELQKVKNQIAANNFRRLQSPFFLLIQLLYFDGMGDWRYINVAGDKWMEVTAEDVQRVAKEYFVDERRAVAQYTREEGSVAEEIPEELAELPDQVRAGIMQQVKQIRQSTDADQLRAASAQIEEQKAQVPPQFQGALGYVQDVIAERLDQLEAIEPTGEEGSSEQKNEGGE